MDEQISAAGVKARRRMRWPIRHATTALMERTDTPTNQRRTNAGSQASRSSRENEPCGFAENPLSTLTVAVIGSGETLWIVVAGAEAALRKFAIDVAISRMN